MLICEELAMLVETYYPRVSDVKTLKGLAMRTLRREDAGFDSILARKGIVTIARVGLSDKGAE